MKTSIKLFAIIYCIITVHFMLTLSGCTSQTAPVEKPAMTHDQMVAHGEYLVTAGQCNDCHSPKTMTKDGPVVDDARKLSGSPAGMKLPKIDTSQITPGKWYLGSSDLTASVGPWGISYSANLTPDTATGTGAWSEELFIKILRSGKFMGSDAARPIMPPMPWYNINKMTDDDLKCILAYLKSLPPISNNVHDYVPPNEIMSVR